VCFTSSPLVSSVISGVGHSTAEKLKGIGVHLVGDLTKPEFQEKIKTTLGAGLAEKMIKHARGLAETYSRIELIKPYIRSFSKIFQTLVLFR
jgi:nucleotidyltransferase/DNA polymerase involved in DNA repair